MVLPTVDEDRPAVAGAGVVGGGPFAAAFATETDPLLAGNDGDDGGRGGSSDRADTSKEGTASALASRRRMRCSSDGAGESSSLSSSSSRDGAEEKDEDEAASEPSWWEKVEGAVTETAENFQHAVVAQVREVADAIHDELRQVGDDDKFFLEMGLARNLSILPGDVVDVAQAASGVSTHAQEAAAIGSQHPHEEAGEEPLREGSAMTTEEPFREELLEAEEEKPTRDEEFSAVVVIPKDLEQSVEFLAGFTRRFSLRRSISGGGGSIGGGDSSWLVSKPFSLIADEESLYLAVESRPDDAATTAATSAAATVPVVPPPRAANAYVLLATAVISLSSIGPFLQLQRDCTPAMKVTWRTCGTAFLLLPLCVLEVRRHGLRSALGGGGGVAAQQPNDDEPVVAIPRLVTFLLSTVSYVVMVMGFVLALHDTAVGNAVILSNSQALLLLVGKVAMGSTVTAMEGSGALTAFCGAVLCSLDSARQAASESLQDAATAAATTTNLPDRVLDLLSSNLMFDSDSPVSPGSSGFSASHLEEAGAPSTLRGDAFALLSGVGGVGYLVFAKAVRARVKLYTFMFATMAVACALCVAAQVCILGETVALSADDRVGLFGFLAPVSDRLYVEILIVFVCNMLGTLGYVRAMQYFDNLVISVASLMEPVVAELMAATMGVSTLPGPMGWLGNALVALGTFAVVYPTPGKSSSASH